MRCVFFNIKLILPLALHFCNVMLSVRHKSNGQRHPSSMFTHSKKKKKNTPNYSSVTTILSALIQLLEQSDNSTIRAV